MSMAILALSDTSRFGGLKAGELREKPTAKQKQEAVRENSGCCLIEPQRYWAIFEAAKQSAMRELTAPEVVTETTEKEKE